MKLHRRLSHLRFIIIIIIIIQNALPTFQPFTRESSPSPKPSTIDRSLQTLGLDRKTGKLTNNKIPTPSRTRLDGGTWIKTQRLFRGNVCHQRIRLQMGGNTKHVGNIIDVVRDPLGDVTVEHIQKLLLNPDEKPHVPCKNLRELYV